MQPVQPGVPIRFANRKTNMTIRNTIPGGTTKKTENARSLFLINDINPIKDEKTAAEKVR